MPDQKLCDIVKYFEHFYGNLVGYKHLSHIGYSTESQMRSFTYAFFNCNHQNDVQKMWPFWPHHSKIMNSESKVDFPMIENNDFLICFNITYYIYCVGRELGSMLPSITLGLV